MFFPVDDQYLNTLMKEGILELNMKCGPDF